MKSLRRLGVDTYMLLLLSAMGLGLFAPLSGALATALGSVTFSAVALLFFLYGGRLEPAALRAGFLNWRLQGLIFCATYVLFPLLGLGFCGVFGPLLGAQMTLALLFLAVLPSTVQSSIALTSIAGGNVPAAISAASVSNLVGVVLTPTLAGLLLSQVDPTISLDSVYRIAIQILVPFLAGQLLRRWIGATIRRHKTFATVVDRGSILLIVYSAFGAGTTSGTWSLIPAAVIAQLIVVVALLLAIVVAAVTLAARLTRLPEEDRLTLLFCGCTKSLASGLPIATAIFPAATLGAVVLPTMIYHMMQLFLCTIIAQRQATLHQRLAS